MCGEQYSLRNSRQHRLGSPPRVRGTGWHFGRPHHFRWITPACAGNSKCDTLFYHPYKDHPRVCGEQPGRPAAHRAGIGSPPRVRGTDFWRVIGCALGGITPACAGNSSWRDCLRLPGTDHPRVCGEQLFASYPVASEVGSPPRVRGTGHPG